MKIKIISFFLFAFLFLSGKLFAQAPDWSWIRGASNGDGILYAVCTDEYGNVYAWSVSSSPQIQFGSYVFNNGGSFDNVLLKYDSTGNLIWAKYENTGSLFSLQCD